MQTPQARIDFNDTSLFGNTAAEEEEADVFDSYFVDRSEIEGFLHDKAPFLILRAYRGEGKSAILRRTLTRLTAEEQVAVRTTGSSLAPEITSSDSSAWTRAWKQKILGFVAAEIGSRIGMAWSDDAITLVEEAEKNSFRSRSLISSIVDRLKLSHVPEKKTLGTSNPEKVVQRWMKNKPLIWLIVDDVDENFVNTAENRAKVASFFSACRQIISLVPELRIRSGIRPNIWQILRSDAESLGKADQYMVDIKWEMPQLRSILARRIEGYLRRSNQTTILGWVERFAGTDREERLIPLALKWTPLFGQKSSLP